jgi:hypothetical protein
MSGHSSAPSAEAPADGGAAKKKSLKDIENEELAAAVEMAKKVRPGAGAGAGVGAGVGAARALLRGGRQRLRPGTGRRRGAWRLRAAAIAAGRGHARGAQLQPSPCWALGGSAAA